MKKLPEWFIPSLQAKDALERWREMREQWNHSMRNDSRGMVRVDRDIQEFSNLVHELVPFLKICLNRLKGKIKVVIFGGGV